MAAIIVLILLMIMSIFFGPAFCGWICPFGTYQEFLGKLGKKIFKKKYNRIIPLKFKKTLSYFRYVVLIWIVYVTANTTVLFFKEIDPYFALFNFYTGEVELTAMIALGIFTIFSLIEERPWCKYFCPLGAFLGLFNKLRVFSIRRNEMTCIDCKKCDNTCPMDIEVSQVTKVTDT